MSPIEFAALTTRIFDNIRALHSIKAGEYAPGADTLANFKEAGNRLGILPEQVLLVYLDKHYAAVQNYIRDLATHTTRNRPEPIEGRVDDLLVYLLLFRALLAERTDAARALRNEPTGLNFDDLPED